MAERDAKRLPDWIRQVNRWGQRRVVGHSCCRPSKLSAPVIDERPMASAPQPFAPDVMGCAQSLPPLGCYGPLLEGRHRDETTLMPACGVGGT
ncbi:hypothetical protein MPLDJ20_220041 [Mesorhizobium plurifarium]|uniref:Uncharacterized protein n=1 Tax=Mesorhizobium plurifarium TaxID=69974 RepID=A0A090F957_MESPL|nr:hypothetical protein MPLDJ20_220041 [Mesorhizobium plurifarium]